MSEPRDSRARHGSRNRERGREGEARAEAFLLSRGYRILARNWRTGRGEVDLVALDGRTVCFVECKTVGADDAGLGGERVEPAQRRRILLAALEYLTLHRLRDCAARIDLVTVVGPDGACSLHQDVLHLDDVLDDTRR